MAIREIIEVPDPRLKQISAPVTQFDADLRTLVSDMFETMYDAPGIGLAAVQVGVPLRVLVIDLQPDDPDAEPVACAHDGHHHHHQPTKREPQVFINPEILEPSDDLKLYNEGCLSVPEMYAEVERPARIRARWQDLDGKVHEGRPDGDLPAARDGPPRRHSVHRPPLAAQAADGAQETGQAAPRGLIFTHVWKIGKGTCVPFSFKYSEMASAIYWAADAKLRIARFLDAP